MLMVNFMLCEFHLLKKKKAWAVTKPPELKPSFGTWSWANFVPVSLKGEISKRGAIIVATCRTVGSIRWVNVPTNLGKVLAYDMTVNMCHDFIAQTLPAIIQATKARQVRGLFKFIQHVQKPSRGWYPALLDSRSMLPLMTTQFDPWPGILTPKPQSLTAAQLLSSAPKHGLPTRQKQKSNNCSCFFPAESLGHLRGTLPTSNDSEPVESFPFLVPITIQF